MKHVVQILSLVLFLQTTLAHDEEATGLAHSMREQTLASLLSQTEERGHISDTATLGTLVPRSGLIPADILFNNKEALLEHLGPTLTYEWLYYAPVSEHKRPLLAWLSQNGLDPVHAFMPEGVDWEATLLDWVLQDLIDNAYRIKSEDRARCEQMLELLLEQGALCNDTTYQEMITNHLDSFIQHPEIVLEKKQKYLFHSTPTSEKPKIPTLVHHIWCTHPDDPQEIRDEEIAQVIANKHLFESSEDTWKHIVWVNDHYLIPQSVKALRVAGVTVMPISLYAQELSNYDLIQTLINDKKWGMASDALRYSLIEYFGGIYADLNFVFTRTLSNDIRRYDFFTEDFLANKVFIDNYFFAAKPKHPIVQETVRLVARNLGPNQPQYLKHIQDSDILTDFATANPTYIAYLHKAHVNGTIDVVYPLYESPEEEAYSKSEEILASKKAHHHYLAAYPSLLEACPDLFQFESAAQYMHDNNICPSPELSYGYDGENGGTWRD